MSMAQKIITLVLFGAASTAVFLGLLSITGVRLNLLSSPYRVNAVAREPINLVPNADVRIDGVIVGKVQEASAQGSAAHMILEIEKTHAPIYRDATFAVRVLTVVGETYIDLDPGSPMAGKMDGGSTIPLEQSEEIVPLEKILNAMDPNTRENVRANLKSLAPALDERGLALNRLFGSTQPTVANGSELMNAVRGQREQLATAIDDTAEVIQVFADRTEQVRTLSNQARRTAEAVASRDESLRAMFRELPPTLSQARGSVDHLSDFSGRAIPVVADLRLAVGDLRPTLVDLRTAAFAGRVLVDELPRFMQRVDPLLAELRPFSRAFRPAVLSLDAFLRQTDPALAYLSDYTREVGGSFWANASSANAPRDALGHLARVHGIVGPQTIAQGQTNAAYDAFVESGLLTEIPENENGTGYPLPGTNDQRNATENYREIEPLRR